jgi:signal transduction histidine kinase
VLFEVQEGDMSRSVSTEEALRITENELRRLSIQHLTIQETERRRIAVELHDGLGQTLSLVKLTAEEAAGALDGDASVRAVHLLERLTHQVRSALGELRRIAMNLRPATLEDLGIVATLSWYFREFQATCPNTRLERDIGVQETDVPEPLKIPIFRIIQEATGNAFKHAKADTIRVCLRSSGASLELIVEDDGLGFDPAIAAKQRDFNHGLGLQSMKERAEVSGAIYELQSAPRKGTRIRVRWPSGEASHSHCPFAQVPLALQPACKSAPRDCELRNRFLVCLACVRSGSPAPHAE